MKQSWLTSVFPIAAIFSFRMLGLFMLIPIFTIYAHQLDQASPSLIGFALGGYGLSQGLLQIPLGMLSDRFGRKPIIGIGLILFALGSLLGAVTHSIYGMILARTIQGSGAIGAVLIALLADLTPDSDRTKAMAVIGATIGLSFSIAILISPTLASHFGLSSIFYCTMLLACIGLGLLYFIIPTPSKQPFHIDSETSPILFKTVLKNRQLQRLNFSIFSQHFILTATFFVLPLLLQQYVQQGHLSKLWHFYLPLVAIAFISMLPLLWLAEKKHLAKLILVAAVLTTGICQGILAMGYTHHGVVYGLMFVYFIAFNFLEATIPALISKQAAPESKGTAMGIYSTSQFLGIFAGGSLSGLLYQFGSISAIFYGNMTIALLWIIVTWAIKPNEYQTQLIIPIPKTMTDETTIINSVKRLPGVLDAVFSAEENILYLKINKAHYQHLSAQHCLGLQN